MYLSLAFVCFWYYLAASSILSKGYIYGGYGAGSTYLQDCDEYDGWYCYDDVRKYEDWYCTPAQCDFDITDEEN